jgi:hypothetical protein
VLEVVVGAIVVVVELEVVVGATVVVVGLGAWGAWGAWRLPTAGSTLQRPL